MYLEQKRFKTAKRHLLQLIFLFVFFSTQAQKVSDIRAEQRGQEIVVLYSLETTSPCEVSLLLSQDNGVTWGSPLKNVSGDVGKNIAAGEKQINWKVWKDVYCTPEFPNLHSYCLDSTYQLFSEQTI